MILSGISASCRIPVNGMNMVNHIVRGDMLFPIRQTIALCRPGVFLLVRVAMYMRYILIGFVC